MVEEVPLFKLYYNNNNKKKQQKPKRKIKTAQIPIPVAGYKAFCIYKVAGKVMQSEYAFQVTRGYFVRGLLDVTACSSTGLEPISGVVPFYLMVLNLSGEGRFVFSSFQ